MQYAKNPLVVVEEGTSTPSFAAPNPSSTGALSSDSTEAPGKALSRSDAGSGSDSTDASGKVLSGTNESTTDAPDTVLSGAGEGAAEEPGKILSRSDSAGKVLGSMPKDKP